MKIPTCAICGRPVDELIAYIDAFTYDRVFVARCHGDREETRISRSDLFDQPLNITAGVAFARTLGTSSEQKV